MLAEHHGLFERVMSGLYRPLQYRMAIEIFYLQVLTNFSSVWSYFCDFLPIFLFIGFWFHFTHLAYLLLFR